MGNGSTGQAPAAPVAEVLAFFTTNDPRPTKGLPANTPASARLTNTERFQKRADSVATKGRVHGVDTIQQATATLKALPANVKLVKVFFVGHGFDDGYFFHGKPDPQSDFVAASSNETLEDPTKVADPTIQQAHKDFLVELVKRVHPTERVEIGFLSCFSGTNSLVGAVCKVMNQAKHRNFIVGGYKNDYQTQYVFDKGTGKILEWTDGIFDKTTKKLLPGTKMSANKIPPYETTCKSDNPIDPLDF